MKYRWFVLLSLLSLSCFAQNISGTVIDDKSFPISFAAVSNVRTQTGGYTDENGKFMIDMKSSLPEDEIVFSHIGYEVVRMTVAQISARQSPITLTATEYKLHEVEIKPTDAKDILMDALSHIKDNYPGDFSRNHVIYKDYLEINDTPMRSYYFDYDLFLPSYLAKDSPRVYSTDKKHDMYTHNAQKQGGGSGSPTHLVKQMYPEKIFDPSELINDGFSLTSTSEIIDSEEYNVVSFKHKPPFLAKSLQIAGTAYINKKDKGIRFINMHMYSLYPGRVMLLAKIDTLNYLENIAFKKVDGKYVLDYIVTSVFARGKLVGKHIGVVQSTSIKVTDRQLKLKANEIEMKTEVDDILLNEKPKDIKEKHAEPIPASKP